MYIYISGIRNITCKTLAFLSKNSTFFKAITWRLCYIYAHVYIYIIYTYIYIYIYIYIRIDVYIYTFFKKGSTFSF